MSPRRIFLAEKASGLEVREFILTFIPWSLLVANQNAGQNGPAMDSSSTQHEAVELASVVQKLQLRKLSDVDLREGCFFLLFCSATQSNCATALGDRQIW